MIMEVEKLEKNSRSDVEILDINTSFDPGSRLNDSKGGRGGKNLNLSRKPVLVF